MSPRSRVIVAAVSVLAVTAAACGQKSGVAGSEAAARSTVAAAPPVTAAAAATTTIAPTPTTEAPAVDTVAPATSAPVVATLGTAAAETSAAAATTSADAAATSAPQGSAAPTTGAPTTAAPTTAAPTTAAPTTAAPTTTAAGPYQAGDDDLAGVTDGEIVIGIHAPVTGASPIPQTSFDVGKDIYWSFLAARAPDQLFGRRVRVVFRDDEFNPQRAVQVCREMVEQEGAFLLVGAGGADQITACADYANRNGVPYLSAGVNAEGLTDLDTYFATSLTYAEQAPLMIDRLVADGITEIGLVVADTPSFDDAFGAIKQAAAAAGVTVRYETRINKTAAEAEQLSVVQELKNAGVAGVVLLSSPLVFIGLANQGVNQGFAPIWMGPGVTSGLNAVTNFGCPGVETGLFFNPTPQLDVIDQLDPDFNAAYAEFGEGEAADDIGLGLWSLNKLLAQVFEATGPELGRAAFMNTLVTAASFDNGIYAPVAFTPEDHFGGTGAHLLDADCSLKQYTTAAQFVEAG